MEAIISDKPVEPTPPDSRGLRDADGRADPPQQEEEARSAPAILFVDDEESILRALVRVFRREGYELVTARSGDDGLRRLNEPGKEFALIVSDQRMPGMKGVEFLEKAKKAAPQAMRILLTGYADMEAIVEAINRGEIHRYLAKPWNEEDLLFQVRQAIRQYDLIRENRRLLELTRRQNETLREWNTRLEEKVRERTQEISGKNETLARLNKDLEGSLYNTVRALGSLTEMHNPLLAGHGKRVSILSREIGRKMKLPEEEITHLEIAALLHDIGKLGLPQKILEYQEERWTGEERNQNQQHAAKGQATVQFIPRLEFVGRLIRSHHELYDGEGFPDHLAAEEIPLGARIITVANEYDRIASLKIGIPVSLKETLKQVRTAGKHLSEDEVFAKLAVAHLKQQSFMRFDPDVVKIFLEHLSSRGIYKGEKRVSFEDLKEGMILSRPLYSSRGRFLLPHRTFLTAHHLEKLEALHLNDPFLEAIYVAIQ